MCHQLQTSLISLAEIVQSKAADILGGEVVPLSVCIDELADEVSSVR